MIFRMLQRKEEDIMKRQAVERRQLPKRIRNERKARDAMFRESLRISLNYGDPDIERDKLKKVNLNFIMTFFVWTNFLFLVPRARKETVYPRATTFRHQTPKTAGRTTSHRWRNRSVIILLLNFDSFIKFVLKCIQWTGTTSKREAEGPAWTWNSQITWMRWCIAAWTSWLEKPTFAQKTGIS